MSIYLSIYLSLSSQLPKSHYICLCVVRIIRISDWAFTANMPLCSKCLLIRIFLTCKCYYSIFVFSKIFVRQSQVIFIIKFHHHFHHHHHQTPNLRNSRNSRNSHTIDRREKLANLISVGLSFCDQVVAKQAVASCIGKGNLKIWLDSVQ